MSSLLRAISIPIPPIIAIEVEEPKHKDKKQQVL
jgi:hypothetical protein